jgi:hypothetical protein
MSAFQAWAAKDFRAEIIGTSCGLFADACIPLPSKKLLLSWLSK